MCPTYTFIDRATGKFNGAMDFKREYSAIVAAGWEIDQAYDRYLRDPDEDSYEQLVQLGLVDYEGEPEAMEQRNGLIKHLVQKVDKNNLFRKRYVTDLTEAAVSLKY